MLEQVLQMQEWIPWVLAVEGMVLCVVQCRANCLLRNMLKDRVVKREKRERLKEEIKNGESKIPVVKFEKEEAKEDASVQERKGTGYDGKEIEVFQEFLAEYFG